MMPDSRCPVCNSNKTSKLFELTSKDAGKLILPDNKEQADHLTELITLLWNNKKCDFFSCKVCEYSFSSPYVAGNEQIYSSLYYKEFEYPNEKWEYSKAIEIIKTHNDLSKTSLLEIGAGNGAFLSKLSSALIQNSNIYSTEYSKPGVESIQEKGFNCLNADIKEIPKISSLPKFQIICMFQVLEHMTDIQKVFNSINAISLPGASLIIAVPNGYLRGFYDKIGLHYDVPPIHVGRFTKKTFQALAGKYGWEFKNSFIEPQRYLFKLKKFIFDRYSRNSLAKKAEKQNNSTLKYLYRYSILLLLIIKNIRVAFKLTNKNTGTSLLVHLKKFGDS